MGLMVLAFAVLVAVGIAAGAGVAFGLFRFAEWLARRDVDRAFARVHARRDREMRT